jgi:hypothetical protein
MNTLDQIKALQKRLELETSCAELLQSDNDIAGLLAKHKNRMHEMIEKPLYTCVCWLSFEATPALIEDIAILYPRLINTLSGSGFWRYTSVPETQAAAAVVLEKDSKAKFLRVTEAEAETSSSGTKVSFYILIKNKPIRIFLDFSYQSRDFIVPYLRENYDYTKNGRNGKQYLGVNGANDQDTCTGQYSFGTLGQLLPKQRG